MNRYYLKKMGLVVLGLLSSITAQSLSQVTAQKMNYTKSVLISPERRYPISEEDFFQVMQDVRRIEAKHVSLLVRGQVFPDDRIEFGANIDGANERGYKTVAGFLHNHDMMFTLKLYLSRGTGDYAQVIHPYDEEAFYLEVMSIVMSYAKMAKKSAADEIALTGIARLACVNPVKFRKLIRAVHAAYPTMRVRLDFASVRDVESHFECLEGSEKLFDQLGIDFAHDPTWEEVEPYVKKGWVISRLTFQGDSAKQDESAANFFAKVPSSAFITLGLLSPGPVYPHYEDEQLRGKSILERMRVWFSKE